MLPVRKMDRRSYRIFEFFLAGLETKSGFSDFYVAIAEVAAGVPFGPRR